PASGPPPATPRPIPCFGGYTISAHNEARPPRRQWVICGWLALIVMRRIAAPMIGGMVTSTALTLAVIPAIYFIWRRRELSRAADSGIRT
ncbi:MAG: hypothetical protein AB7I33_17840, partial [Gemmatimonadales bacterium]